MKFTDFLHTNSTVNEALTNNLATANFKLKSSKITDQHIKNTIELYAKAKGLTFAEVQDMFKVRLDKQISDLGSSMINKNGVENAADSVAFNLISELSPREIDLSAYGIDDSEDLLDRDYFFDLTEFVLGENSRFFPLRNPFEPKAVRPYFFITPDHLPLIKDESLKNSAKNNCKTAFCTPNAEMVFNRKFTEQLAISALLNNVKPKSKKYKNNGGPIPDHYAYLEFVIMHELLHFTAGDHFYTKSMVKKITKENPKISVKMAHKILNYVGDYINNWTLAKSGYEQLPIGLFSEDINYDKIGSYEGVIDVVIAEINNMTPEDVEKMTDTMEEDMDDHVDNEDDTPSAGGADSEPQYSGDEEPGDSSDSGDSSNKIYKKGDKLKIKSTGAIVTVTHASEPDENGKQTIQVTDVDDSTVNEAVFTVSSDDVELYQDPGEPGEPGEPGDGEPGEPGDGEPGDGEPGEPGDARSKAVNDAMKKNSDNVEKRDDANNDSKSALEKEAEDERAEEAGKRNISAAQEVDFREVQTTVNWKKLMKKMIPSGTGDAEDSYSKMSRQATSSMITAQQTGAGRISPGEVIIDSNKKGLVFVIDNSGSVIRIVNQFNQEILTLIKKNSKLLDNMFVIKFSATFEVFKVDVKNKEFKKIKNEDSISDKKIKPEYESAEKLVQLFKETFAVGTEYTNSMHNVIESLHKQNMNIIMFTDDDLASKPNTKKFFLLNKKRKNSLAVLITSDRHRDSMAKAFGDYKWMTVLK